MTVPALYATQDAKSGTRQSAVFLFAFAALFLIAIYPVFNVHNPPLQDYANHLARMHILANPDAPFLRDYWELNWTALPNLAMDLTVPILAMWMPLEMAGKVFVAATFFLLVSGTAAIHFALYRRFSLVPLLAILLLPNLALQKGFLNYLFSVSLALWAYAGWIMVSKRSSGVRIAYNLCLSPILYFSHLHGLAVYAVEVVASETLGWKKDGPNTMAAVRMRVSVALAGFLPILIFHTLHSGMSDVSPAWVYPHFQDKLLLGRYLIPLFDDRLDAVMTLVMGAVLVSALLARRLSYPKPVAMALLALLASYSILPGTALTGANVDWRTLVPLAFLAIGGASIAREPTFGTVRNVSLLASLAFLATLRFAYLNSLWVSADQHFVEIQRVFQHIPQGAKLFSAVRDMPYREASQQRALLHIPSYAVIERSAFVPSLFAFPVQQPIRIRLELAPLVSRDNRNPYHGPDKPIDCARVSAGFEYALVIAGKELEDGRPCGWSPVMRTQSMHLFRIGPPQ